jgi:hypothetical protein
VIANRIAERVRWGYNIAARTLGEPAIAFRPIDPFHPLTPAGRYLRLAAAFTSLDGGYSRPNVYGSALWVGIYDSSQTWVGDYLTQGQAIWFIASQDDMMPNLCVRTNRIVSLKRAITPGPTGVPIQSPVTIASDWPVSMLGVSLSGRADAGLPTDLSSPYWTILMPNIPACVLQASDTVTDDLGRTGTVLATELSALGWRLTVKGQST